MAKARKSPKPGSRVQQMLGIYDLVRRAARQPVNKRQSLIEMLVKRLRAVPEPYAH